MANSAIAMCITISQIQVQTWNCTLHSFNISDVFRFKTVSMWDKTGRYFISSRQQIWCRAGSRILNLAAGSWFTSFGQTLSVMWCWSTVGTVVSSLCGSYLWSQPIVSCICDIWYLDVQFSRCCQFILLVWCLWTF